jgi:hypothetical protein
LVQDMIVTRFGAPVGQQRNHNPKRVNLRTHARQKHLFLSQHFVDVFHEPPSWGNQGPQNCVRLENDCFLLWLDCANSNTDFVQTAICKTVTLQLPLVRDI